MRPWLPLQCRDHRLELKSREIPIHRGWPFPRLQLPFLRLASLRAHQRQRRGRVVLFQGSYSFLGPPAFPVCLTNKSVGSSLQNVWRRLFPQQVCTSASSIPAPGVLGLVRSAIRRRMCVFEFCVASLCSVQSPYCSPAATRRCLAPPHPKGCFNAQGIGACCVRARVLCGWRSPPAARRGQCPHAGGGRGRHAHEALWCAVARSGCVV